MDINLTGMIAENLVENLKPQFWNSAILFGVITAILTSIITFCTVKITNKTAEEREERNRNEERQKILRDDRRQVYLQFIAYIYRADAMNMAKNSNHPFDIDKHFNDFINCFSGIVLLSPKVAKTIEDTVLKYPFTGTNYKETWNQISIELKDKVVPIMQAELGVGP